MSSPIWTAEELESNIVFLRGSAWRFVESQSIKSTMKLVDTEEEQYRLEELLEESKPPIPRACEGLDYLLFTPFRYTPPHHGSRFRRAGQRDGAFYASELLDTALAEISFYRLLFFRESPNTPVPANPCEHTGFQIDYESGRALDLTQEPLKLDEEAWTNKNDYNACQDLADEARKADIEVMRSKSVRCTMQGKNITLLKCAAFASKKPHKFETWHISIKEDRVIAQRSLPTKTITFTLDDFKNDPRLGEVA